LSLRRALFNATILNLDTWWLPCTGRHVTRMQPKPSELMLVRRLSSSGLEPCSRLFWNSSSPLIERLERWLRQCAFVVESIAQRRRPRQADRSSHFHNEGVIRKPKHELLATLSCWRDNPAGNARDTRQFSIHPEIRHADDLPSSGTTGGTRSRQTLRARDSATLCRSPDRQALRPGRAR
jgi:hypothetical protein